MLVIRLAGPGDDVGAGRVARNVRERAVYAGGRLQDSGPESDYDPAVLPAGKTLNLEGDDAWGLFVSRLISSGFKNNSRNGFAGNHG
jgi:hypothetical protein